LASASRRILMAFFRKGGKRASELLDLCKETYAVRSAEYGDSYIVIGNALSAIFPEGVELKTEEDFRRFHLFAWTVGKLVRYSQNWSSGGHGDSLHDAIVYMAILGTEDENLKKETEDEGVDF
jgi:hypothetical protein